MAQLMSLINEKQQQTSSNQFSGGLNQPSQHDPAVISNCQSAISRPVRITSRKKSKSSSKSPSKKANPQRNGRKATCRSGTSRSRSRSQSGCSVCDNEKRRSRSRSRSLTNSSKKKPDAFLKELLDSNKSPNHSAVFTKSADASNFDHSELSKPTLFDTYLVNLKSFKIILKYTIEFFTVNIFRRKKLKSLT